MSGNSGGGYQPAGPSDCKLLVIITQLASPVPSVISKLKVGDMLEVELTPPAGPVQIRTSTGEVAGSILHMDVANLIQCISDGYEYSAKVLEIKGGNCQVRIKHI